MDDRTDAELPSIKAVVFDLDGLMFNTESVFNRAGTELLRRRGKEPHPELFQRMMGRRPVEGFAVMIELMSLTETYEELLFESEQIFTGMLDDHLAPMPGLYELLELIEDRGLHKGVATSSPRRYLENMLERFRLGERFQVTLAAEDVSRGKPDPEIYLKAAVRLGVDAHEMLVLEDSEMGTRAAAAAGAYIISVPHEYSCAHNFEAARCTAQSLVDPVILRLLGEFGPLARRSV
jgi:HAD superfamily hydrolase (TIGR01509 family)